MLLKLKVIKKIALNLSINNELLNSKNNIIIFGGATSLYFYEKRFINKDSNWHLTFVNPESLEHNSELLKKDFINILVNLTKNNDVILLYPIPEIGVNIQKNKLNTESFTYKNFLRCFILIITLVVCYQTLGLTSK